MKEKRMILICFAAVLMLVATPSNADTTLSAEKPSSVSVIGSSGSHTFSWGTSLVTAIKDENSISAPIDSALEQCVSVIGTTAIASFPLQLDSSATTWGATLTPTKSVVGSDDGFTAGFNATLTNKCGHDVNGYIGLWPSDGPPISVAFAIPDTRSCQVTVKNPVDLGSFNIGDSPGDVVITAGAQGAGSIKLTPDAGSKDGGLLKDAGGDVLTYRLASKGGASWDPVAGSISGSLDQDFTVGMDKIGTTAKGGNYAGTLVAELTCE